MRNAPRWWALADRGPYIVVLIAASQRQLAYKVIEMQSICVNESEYVASTAASQYQLVGMQSHRFG
jgi:hypothetical protein